MPEVPRQRVDSVLEGCGVSGDREAYYKFMHRLVHDEIESKEELDALLKEFKAKGCDGRALMKLAELNSLFNPSQYMEGRSDLAGALRKYRLPLLAIVMVIAAMLVMFHGSFIMDQWVPGPTQRLLIIGAIVVIAALVMLLGIAEDRKRSAR
jgi:hypothetical protein